MRLGYSSTKRGCLHVGCPVCIPGERNVEVHGGVKMHETGTLEKRSHQQIEARKGIQVAPLPHRIQRGGLSRPAERASPNVLPDLQLQMTAPAAGLSLQTAGYDHAYIPQTPQLIIVTHKLIILTLCFVDLVDFNRFHKP